MEKGMNVGRGIKLILASRGMSQKELARKTRISETSISLLCKNHTQPHKASLITIAKALGTKPEFIMLLSVSREDIPVEKQALYDFVWPELERTFIKLFL